ncbi:MAG: ribose 5-phosphate isomerase B [Deltaproteobacteria bacterium]|jgi:ribose 5-phosphate isomerase B|nr:ribose 5-phosphate isomerase B [Deltaproteobacteria bacterium]MBW2477175.1 ribose 5-phosphate isomerase B [Deltaproteobacteria bacterium]MBW2504734.1 ribose 5-phosphate isomerase B [Deltaproteobacteria bacterium]MBW2520937.1 ribose 5-phosphate isomerase B [Deltaproteobacteria bacterium]
MRIVIGSDHGGLELKSAVNELLQQRGMTVSDLGTDNDDSVDYPDFAERVAIAVSRLEADLGILICGTGIGMSIVANKFPKVRAALVTDEFMAQMAKEHNDANILVLGGRVLTAERACRMVNIWLDAIYEGGRHQRRLDKIARIEDDVRNERI